jgi:protein-S-isoprenylcysteine O-methyltransferase Ste14
METIPEKNPLSQWLILVIVYLLIPGTLLSCAGDWGWRQAWIYSGLLFAAGIGGRAWSELRHPGIMAERVNLEKFSDSKPWDKILAPLMAFSIGFPLVIVAGLDHRFGWSPTFPLWVNLLGLLLIALGYGLAVWAMVENRFFSSVVRIQTERGHMVCETGPYRFVRHPGYAGNILPLIGIVLALDSLWTLIPVGAALVIFLIRTAMEDKTLQEELPGYREYTHKVKYRLLPGVW